MEFAFNWIQTEWLLFRLFYFVLAKKRRKSENEINRKFDYLVIRAGRNGFELGWSVEGYQMWQICPIFGSISRSGLDLREVNERGFPNEWKDLWMAEN